MTTLESRAVSLGIIGSIKMELLNTPTLPDNIGDCVTTLANQVYTIDEAVYHYAADPESGVTVEHIRQESIKLIAKTFRFIQSLPAPTEQ